MSLYVQDALRRAVRDRLQSATPKAKIFNNFINMQCIITKVTSHINGVLVIVLQHLFAFLLILIYVYLLVYTVFPLT